MKSKVVRITGLRYGKRYAACISTWHTASFWYGNGKCIYCGKKRELAEKYDKMTKEYKHLTGLDWKEKK